MRPDVFVMSTTQRKDKTDGAPAKKAGARAKAKAAGIAVKSSADVVVETTETAPVVEQPSALETPGAGCEIALLSHCSIKDAAKLKRDLLALAHAAEAVAVDVSAVERIDTATMQLLCAFARDRAARQQAVVWRGDSPSWREAVRLLGVQQWIGAAEGHAQ